MNSTTAASRLLQDIQSKNVKISDIEISNNNVSVRLSRIRGKLKRYLKKEGVEV